MHDGILPVSTRPRSVATHQKVLDSANALLIKHGYHGVSIERIADHSGVSTATIYKHWPSKNAIIAEAFGQVASRTLRIPTEGDPMTNVIEYAVESLTFHNFKGGRVFFQLLAACSMEPHGATYFNKYYLDPRRASLRPLFERAYEAGQISSEIDLNTAEDLVFGAAVFRLMRNPESIDVDAIRQTIQCSVRGLLTSEH